MYTRQACAACRLHYSIYPNSLIHSQHSNLHNREKIPLQLAVNDRSVAILNSEYSIVCLTIPVLESGINIFRQITYHFEYLNTIIIVYC